MDSAKKKILLLDDSEVIRAAATFQLEKAGYQVTAVASIDELEQIGNPQDADLILLDVEIEQVFGDDVGMVLRQVRDVQAPIWLFSSRPPSELAERAKDAGIDGFISKHEGLDHLVAKIGEILAD